MGESLANPGLKGECLDWARFEVLTFDCYGTLIDWESGLLAALRAVLHAEQGGSDARRYDFKRFRAPFGVEPNDKQVLPAHWLQVRVQFD